MFKFVANCNPDKYFCSAREKFDRVRLSGAHFRALGTTVLTFIWFCTFCIRCWNFSTLDCTLIRHGHGTTNPKNKEKTKRTKWGEARVFKLLSQYAFYKTQGDSSVLETIRRGLGIIWRVLENIWWVLLAIDSLDYIFGYIHGERLSTLSGDATRCC